MQRFSRTIENRPAVLFKLWHLPPLGFSAEYEPRYRRVPDQKVEIIFVSACQNCLPFANLA